MKMTLATAGALILMAFAVRLTYVQAQNNETEALPRNPTPRGCASIRKTKPLANIRVPKEFHRASESIGSIPNFSLNDTSARDYFLKSSQSGNLPWARPILLASMREQTDYVLVCGLHYLK